jgi:hypothetical protein
MAAVVPRVLTSKDYDGALLAWNWAPNQEKNPIDLDLRVQFEPRGREYTVEMKILPGLVSAFNPGEWGIEGESTVESAMQMILAVYSLAAGDDLKEGSTHAKAASALNVNSFVDRFKRMGPASDEEIWGYIARRVYWSWRFGLPATSFDHTDNLLLGLPRDEVDHERHLTPGQIQRVAWPGVDEYWRRIADSEYVPTLKLIQRFNEESLRL